MAERTSRPVHHIQLSSQAMLAAQRVAEIAGLPTSELLEVVLLELAESGAAVEADLAGKRRKATSGGPREAATVIPIERGRRGARRPSGGGEPRRGDVPSASESEPAEEGPGEGT